MVVVELGRQGGGEGGRLKLLVLVHLGVLLQLVVVDDVLVGRARLGERVQLVHVAHVAPDGRQRPRDLKFRKVLAGDADVLQAGHELAVEAAHGVAREEALAPPAQVGVNVAQLVQQGLLGRLVPPGQHQLELLHSGWGRGKEEEEKEGESGRNLALSKRLTKVRATGGGNAESEPLHFCFHICTIYLVL